MSKRKNRLGLSKGEMKIKSYLVTTGYNYEIEKEFDDLVNPKTGAKLRFDFFLPDYNAVIEFDGFHHYSERSKYHDNRNSFVRQKVRDNIKDKYCENKGMHLIRISCFDNSKMYRIINERLKQIDNEHKEQEYNSQSSVSTI
jgi:very-short-patch-repair endonuclease